MQYSPKVLDHYRHPRNFGILKGATHTATELNPLCGDEISVYLSAQGGSASGRQIHDIKYEARGCALSIASASVLSEYLKGRKFESINKSDIEKMLGINGNEVRESCIMLIVKAINKAKNINL